MKKQFSLLVLTWVCMFPAVSIARMWIEFEYDDTFQPRYTIMAERYTNPALYPYEIYVGSLSYAFDSISALPNAGTGASFSPTDFDQYPTAYHLQSGLDPVAGEQFELLSQWGSYLIALYDSNFQVIGSYSMALDTGIRLHIPQTYTIGPGQSVDLIGYSYKIPGGAGWVERTDFSEQCMDGWYINGSSIPQHVSYETLTQQMGLSPGMHEIELYQEWAYLYIPELDETLVADAWETTTITIVPEPCTVLLLGLGGLLIKKR